MRVALLGINFPPEPTGIAPYAGALAEGLAVRGFDVQVITAHPHYPQWTIRPGYGRWTQRERVGETDVTRLLHFVPRVPKGLARLVSELSFGLRLVTRRWGSPDVVVMVSPALFATWMAGMRARLTRRPTVVWVQDLYELGVSETGGGGAVERIIGAVERATLRRAGQVVVIHDRFGRYVSEQVGVPGERISTVRNWSHAEPPRGVDVAATRARHGWGPDETIVLHAGNMGMKQGLRNVVDAARLADERSAPVRFVLLGHGGERPALEREGAGIERLQFIELLDDAGFAAALASADVLLVNELPGVAEMAVPSKLTSYFGSGRPIVAAVDPAGACADEVRAAGAGAIVPAGDPEAVLDAALALRDDPDAAARYAAAGLAYRHDVLGETAALDRFAALLRG